jgi:hypothetical protein
VARLGVRENLWRRIGRDWTWEWVDQHGLIQRFIVNCFQDLPVTKWDDLATELDSLHVYRSLDVIFIYIIIINLKIIKVIFVVPGLSFVCFQLSSTEEEAVHHTVQIKFLYFFYQTKVK